MGKAPNRQASDLTVTEFEGSVLGLISRTQPVLRYGLFKAFEQSPATGFRSKGGLYPLVDRLIARGLIASSGKEKGNRGAKLSLTALGHDALSEWVGRADPEQSLTSDPMLLRMLALGDLEPEDRLKWIADAKASLLVSKEQLKSNPETFAGPYGDLAQVAAIAMIDAKLESLDRLLIQVVREERASPGGGQG